MFPILFVHQPSQYVDWETFTPSCVYRLYDNLPEDEILFSERLQNIGYQTALFRKLHVSSSVYEEAKRHPHDGFDIYEWCMEAQH